MFYNIIIILYVIIINKKSTSKANVSLPDCLHDSEDRLLSASFGMCSFVGYAASLSSRR